MDLFAPRHLLIILLIALIVFGGKKLRTLGGDLGAAIRDFKKAMKDDESAGDTKQLTTTSTSSAPAEDKQPGAV
jgi:TatA/E family protein of Tat protein translocase